MNFKKLNGTPCGAVRIDGDETLTLHDGSTVEAYEDAFDSEMPARYERVTRPDGKVLWYQLQPEAE